VKKQLVNKTAKGVILFLLGLIPFTAGYVTGVTEPQAARAIKEALKKPTKVVTVEKEIIVERPIIPSTDITDAVEYIMKSEEAWISIRNDESKYTKTHRIALTCRPPGSTLKTEVSTDMDTFPFIHLALVELVEKTKDLQAMHRQEK